MKKHLLMIPLFAFLLNACGGGTKTLQSLSLSTYSSVYKDSYAVGSSYSTQGLTVTAKYSDTSSKDVTDYKTSIAVGYKFTLADVGTAKPVEVSYTENAITVKDTLKINVYRKIKSAVISGEFKKSYKVGEAFSLKGVVVTANYEDGGSEVFDKYSFVDPQEGYKFQTSDINPNYFFTIEISNTYSTAKATEFISVTAE